SAQYKLGVFYDNGLGVPQDHISAYMWLNLSAAQGRDGAAAFRDLIARRMTPAQIAEAQKLAREWKPTTRPPRSVPSQLNVVHPNVRLQLRLSAPSLFRDLSIGAWELTKVR